jgi:hypothetical protein
MKTLPTVTILPKAASAVMKGFLKAASCYLNRFQKAAGVDNLSVIFNTICSIFGYPIVTTLAALKILKTNRI